MDTNVIVSGLLNPFGFPGEVVRLIATDTIQICYNIKIIKEYIEVLNRKKFDFDKEKIEILISYIKETGTNVFSIPLNLKLPDPSDEIFLEVAIASNSEFLITGNKIHFKPFKGSKPEIVNPKEFLEKVRFG